jgi:hypothetical protein
MAQAPEHFPVTNTNVPLKDGDQIRTQRLNSPERTPRNTFQLPMSPTINAKVFYHVEPRVSCVSSSSKISQESSPNLREPRRKKRRLTPPCFYFNKRENGCGFCKFDHYCAVCGSEEHGMSNCLKYQDGRRVQAVSSAKSTLKEVVHVEINVQDGIGVCYVTKNIQWEVGNAACFKFE